MTMGSRGLGRRRPAVGEREIGLLLAATTGLLLSCLAASADVPSNLEKEAFRAINGGPGGLTLLVNSLGQLGNLLAVPLVALVALAFRRWRLASGLAAAGLGAWLMAKLVKRVVIRERPSDYLAEVIIRGELQTGLGFVSGHVAVVTALATVASSYLGRWRWGAWTLVAVVGLSRIYVGAHLPLDSIGGFFLGWLIGLVILLLLRRVEAPG
jgi:undecaprenyl-diphosphatase